MEEWFLFLSFGVTLHWFMEFSKEKNSQSFIVRNGGWRERCLLSKRECFCWRIHNQMAPLLYVPHFIPHQTQIHTSH